MKIYLFALFGLLGLTRIKAQIKSFEIKGDFNLYYPIVIIDSGWNQNIPTQFSIGLSESNNDSIWSDSLIARFSFHVTNNGSSASFVSLELKPTNSILGINSFVGGYVDATLDNSDTKFIIWLKGNQRYFYRSNFILIPIIYDNSQNTLPFVESSGTLIDLKSQPDSDTVYINPLILHTLDFQFGIFLYHINSCFILSDLYKRRNFNDYL